MCQSKRRMRSNNNHDHNQNNRKQGDQEAGQDASSIKSMIALVWTTTFWSQRCIRPVCSWLLAGRTNGYHDKPSSCSSLRALTLLWLLLCTSLVMKHRDLLSVFWSFCASFGLAAILSRVLLLGYWLSVPPRQTNGSSATLKSLPPEGSLLSSSSSSSQGSMKNKNLVGIIACLVAWMHLDGKLYFLSSSLSSSSTEFTALSILAGYLAFDHWFAGLYCKNPPKSLGSVTEDALTLTGMLILLAASSSSSSTVLSSSSSPPAFSSSLSLSLFSLGTFAWKGGLQLSHYSIWMRAWIVYKLLRLAIDLVWNRQYIFSADASNKSSEDGASRSASAICEPKDTFVQLTGVVADLHPVASAEIHPDKAVLPSPISSPAVPTKTTILSSNYWIIHGRYYDLTDFVYRHPGGAEALLLVQGRDGTALFESYHPFTRSQAQSVLNKYEVTCEPRASTLPTSTLRSNNKDKVSKCPDIFYQVLCQRVAKTLASKGIDPVMHRAATPLRAVYYLLILAGVVISGVSHVRVRCH